LSSGAIAKKIGSIFVNYLAEPKINDFFTSNNKYFEKLCQLLSAPNAAALDFLNI
jgi:hypothetical protein